MTEPLVQTELQGSIALVKLDRPAKRNALNRAMLTELVRTLRECDAEPGVRAIVNSGGEQAFAAGADIGALAAANAIELYTSGFSEMWDDAAAIAKPLIAAVSGYTLGGGLELALICDIIVADQTAIFGMPEAGIGTIPGAGGTQRLVRAVGKSMAMEMILAGRRLDANEALTFGLVSTVSNEGQSSQAAAFVVAERIATAAPLAVSMAKSAVLESYETTLAAGIRYERSLSALIAASDDRAEGVRAFAAKERPVFKGK
jgi:enoyl-CoA hydratase